MGKKEKFAILAAGLSVAAPNCFAVVCNESSDEVIWVIKEFRDNDSDWVQLAPSECYYWFHEGYVTQSSVSYYNQNPYVYGDWFKTPMSSASNYYGDNYATTNIFGAGSWQQNPEWAVITNVYDYFASYYPYPC